MNYFTYLCFGWAFIAIVTRIFMTFSTEKWNQWEFDKAYTKEKPKWINVVAILGVGIIGFTWYQVYALDIKYSWVIATILTLTLIKLSKLVFNYNAFRTFGIETLTNSKKRAKLNISVLVIAFIFIALGIFVY